MNSQSATGWSTWSGASRPVSKTRARPTAAASLYGEDADSAGAERFVAVVGFDARDAAVARFDELRDVRGERLPPSKRPHVARDRTRPGEAYDDESAVLDGVVD